MITIGRCRILPLRFWLYILSLETLGLSVAESIRKGPNFIFGRDDMSDTLVVLPLFYISPHSVNDVIRALACEMMTAYLLS